LSATVAFGQKIVFDVLDPLFVSRQFGTHGFHACFIFIASPGAPILDRADRDSRGVGVVAGSASVVVMSATDSARDCVWGGSDAERKLITSAEFSMG
jgi:hypothetical protein